MKLDPLVEEARYQDIARRLLQGQRTAAIAQAHDMTPRQMRNVLRDPRMVEVYEEAKTALFEDVDGLIRDEKAHVTLRRQALHTRGMTLLGEVLGELQAHISRNEETTGSKGTTRASHLEAAIRASRAAYEMSGMADRSATTKVTVGILNVPSQAADTIRATASESGVDISDIMDITPTACPVEDEISEPIPESPPNPRTPLDAPPQPEDESFLDIQTPLVFRRSQRDYHESPAEDS